MKNRGISDFCTVALLAFLNTNVSAAHDGTLNFSGNITNRTCSIVGGNTLTVTLPTVARETLSSPGSLSGVTFFVLALTECDATANGIYAYFNNDKGVDAEGRLLNSGTAKNVALELRDARYAFIPIGSADQTNSPFFTAVSVDGQARLYYSAQYYATGVVTAGTVSATVTYSVVYL